MKEPRTDIHQSTDCIGISDALIDLIVDKMVDDMNLHISSIELGDDPSAEYGEYWTYGSCINDDCLELNEPYDGYEVSYEYELSWRYREWTEYWTDPVCYPSFDEMDDEKGEVTSLAVFDPDGNEWPEDICNEIIKRVNELI